MMKKFQSMMKNFQSMMKKFLSIIDKHFYTVLLAPFMILSIVFTLIPIINSFYISFFDFSFLNPSDKEFVFLNNFKALFQDKVFINALKNTFLITIIVVPVEMFLSMIVAVFLNSKIKYSNLYKTIIYLPYIVSPIAIGAIISQLFTKNSKLVLFLSKFGFENVTWNATSPYAFWLVVLVIIWTQLGFFMVIYLSALKEIPSEMYEAAEIDGANEKQKFWKITYPLLKNTRFLIVFMCLLVSFQLFEIPYLISTIGGTSPGSPNNSTMTLVMYIYSRAFRYNEMGLASAASTVLFIIIFGFSLVQNKLGERGE